MWTSLLKRFEQPWEDSDVVIDVDGFKFHTHLSILRWNSSVLNAMFTNDGFAESLDKKVTLPGKNRKVFSYFLYFMYPAEEGVDISLQKDIVSRLNQQYEFDMSGEEDFWFVIELLKYADEYIASGVKARLDRVLSGCFKFLDYSSDDSTDILLYAILKLVDILERYYLPDLHMTTMRLLVNIRRELQHRSGSSSRHRQQQSQITAAEAKMAMLSFNLVAEQF